MAKFFVVYCIHRVFLSCSRYQHSGEPLLMRNEDRIGNVPCCQLCGAKRVFELQLMPALVHFLRDPLSNGNKIHLKQMFVSNTQPLIRSVVFRGFGRVWHCFGVYVRKQLRRDDFEWRHGRTRHRSGGPRCWADDVKVWKLQSDIRAN